uniref:DNA mismatch repair protein MutS-like N-terminal domain-containing protein n=1 Tax=Panagrolaimus sp. ES5 TaxID=591445 RepID=A0AC34G8Y4_9BILA
MKKSQPSKSPKTTPKTPKTPSNQSSLFSYFKKVEPTTPSSSTKQDQKPTKQVSPNENIPLDRKRSVIELEDESPSVTRTQTKRRRIVVESSDEDIEAMETSPAKPGPSTPPKVEGTPKTPSSGRHRIILKEEDSSFEFEDEPTPEKKKKPATQRTPSASRKKVASLIKPATEVTPSKPKSSEPATPHTPGAVKQAYESFRVDAETDPELVSHKSSKKKQKIEDFVDTERWVHETFEFLLPENIRDINKRRPDHAEYDPKTLYVPKEYFDKQTPGHQQWWKMKSLYFDTILFFKVGKFYELYHMDAVVGIN